MDTATATTIVEKILEKLKQNPDKDAEDKSLIIKKLEAQHEVLSRKLKHAEEYIASLEEYNDMLKRGQCQCNGPTAVDCACPMRPTKGGDMFSFIVWAIIFYFMFTLLRDPPCCL